MASRVGKAFIESKTQRISVVRWVTANPGLAPRSASMVHEKPPFSNRARRRAPSVSLVSAVRDSWGYTSGRRWRPPAARTWHNTVTY